MKRFEIGDRVRVNIPNEDDHERLHQKHGIIVKYLKTTLLKNGRSRDSYLFRVEIDEGVIEDLRWRSPTCLKCIIAPSSGF